MRSPALTSVLIGGSLHFARIQFIQASLKPVSKELALTGRVTGNSTRLPDGVEKHRANSYHTLRPEPPPGRLRKHALASERRAGDTPTSPDIPDEVTR